VQTVALREQTFEDRRDDDSRLTWKLQRFVYTDGTTVLTLAGLQFEEALGLSVVVVDPPPAALLSRPMSVTSEPPAKDNTELTQTSEAPTGRMLSDIPSMDDSRLPAEAARADLQLRNLLIPLADLKKKDSTGVEVLPACAQGQRRAVAFIRAHQLARMLEISNERAEMLSTWGRAACVKWNGFPKQKNQLKTEGQSVSLSQ
jgi:hypothetical protein